MGRRVSERSEVSGCCLLIFVTGYFLFCSTGDRSQQVCTAAFLALHPESFQTAEQVTQCQLQMGHVAVVVCGSCGLWQRSVCEKGRFMQSGEIVGRKPILG